MTTVLSACKDLCFRVGIPAPSAVMTSTNELTLQILGIFVEAARDLAKAHKWESLQHEAEFTTVAGEEQAVMATIAPGFKEFIPRTFVNKTQGHLLVPINAEEAASQHIQPATFMGRAYRVVRGKILMPGAVAGQLHRFEYRSDLFIMDADGEEYSNLPAADSDLVLLPDECLILGMKWRWKKEKGLAYGEDKNDYLAEIESERGSNGAERKNLSLNTQGARRGTVGLGNLTIPG